MLIEFENVRKRVGSDRYYREDVIDPPDEVSSRGTIRCSQEPGIGYTVLEERLQKYAVRREGVSS